VAFPTYADLPRPAGETLPLAWGVWGADDQIGMWNNLTPEHTQHAASLIRTGRRFNLNLPLHVPLGLLGAGAHANRQPPVQTLYEVGEGSIVGRDDKVELFPQASTQWDGLTHIGDGRHGFYNGVRPDQITQREGTRNGIEHVAQFAAAGRGVLVDLPSHFAATGRSWSPMGSQVANADDVQACLARTGEDLRQGDVLLVRTGWLRAFLDAPPPDRYALYRARTYSGLSGGEDMWAYLWDHRVAAVASDSVTVEAFPIMGETPSLHLAIARLGMNLGELFDLEALTAHCLAIGSFACFFTSMPLNLRGGVGSPANAIAIV
jgi:kynurenine formamidase